MNAINAKFQEHTRGQYGYLKIISGTYFTDKNLLRVQILQSTAEGVSFNDADKQSVYDALKTLLPEGLDITPEYIKTFADADIVRSKAILYLSKNHSAVFSRLKSGDIEVAVDGYTISITLSVLPAFIPILEKQNAEERLADCLEDQFVEAVQVSVAEKYVEAGAAEADSIDSTEEERQKFVAEARFVRIGVGKLIYSSKVKQSGTAKQSTVKKTEIKEEQLNAYPIYISDAKAGNQETVLCGRIDSADRRDYVNKNYGAESAGKGERRINTEDERLPMFKLTLNDTTGTVNAVIFPFGCVNHELDEFFDGAAGKEVVCAGYLSTGNYGLQFSVKRMWHAEIDFSSVKNLRPQKPVSDSYRIVIPKKYVETQQEQVSFLPSLADATGCGGQGEVPEFLKGRTFVAFDLETTGTNTFSDKIIEIGAVKISGGQLVETFYTRVNPQMPIPADSSKIHNIFDADVADMPLFGDIAGDFYKFTRGTTLVAHNARGFDVPVLNNNGKPHEYYFDNPVVDTLELSRKYLKLSDNKLSSVCGYFGVSLENAHCAMDDAVACAKCLKKLAGLIK